MWRQSLRVTSCLCFSTSKITLQQKPFHTQTICHCNVSRHDSYYVLHPNPHKAISSRNTNSEVNAAAEWTDKQTLCHFWLGITSGVMEEDGASKVWPSLFIHTAWRNSKLTHPGGQMQRGCKTHHTHTHTHTLFVCWLWILHIRVQSPSEGLVIGRWMAVLFTAWTSHSSQHCPWPECVLEVHKFGLTVLLERTMRTWPFLSDLNNYITLWQKLRGDEEIFHLMILWYQ